MGMNDEKNALNRQDNARLTLAKLVSIRYIQASE
jgi:hypothetical protein